MNAAATEPYRDRTLNRSAGKRQSIIDAATQLFLANGYSRTTMDDIAALASVSKQTVYMHFGDKERLVTEMVMESVP